jgi:hypothetical protein
MFSKNTRPASVPVGFKILGVRIHPSKPYWWSLSGSNRRPPACKAGALPAELRPHKWSQVVGLGGLEPPTSPLSGVRSNHLSYRPIRLGLRLARYKACVDVQVTCVEALRRDACLSRKEVIQPHLPIRLPCYDFTPVMNHSVVVVPLAVRLTASGAAHSHGVTGGVYKARERIHRSIADLRLLAIPTSWSRVADSNPDWDRLSGIGSTSRYCNPLYRPL